MTTIRTYRVGGGNQGGNPFGPFGSILMLIVGIILTYLIAKGIFTLLILFSIPLLIAGILLDPKGALGFGKAFVSLAKKNPIVPIGILIIAGIFYQTVPYILMAFTGGALIARSFVRKKMEKMFGPEVMNRQKEPEFTDYEEVADEEDFLELPQIEKETKGKASNNEYDNLFD